MIKLYQFPPAFGRNVSPFTLKLETWLKIARLPYEVVEIQNPRRAPKGKLPFIEDEDGTVIGDSSLIIEHLERTRGIDADGELVPAQRAQAVALQRLLEDHFYFILSWSRWIDPEGWRTFAPALFGFLPPGADRLLPLLLRRRMRRDLRAQGLGRHRQAEVYAQGRADLEAVSIMLGERSFFFGERPTTTDAIAYGFLANLLLVPIETDLKRIALDFPKLL
ncbi:MAG: glutathione S-transferase family protein, partial [Geminicoccales bacterium]